MQKKSFSLFHKGIIVSLALMVSISLTYIVSAAYSSAIQEKVDNLLSSVRSNAESLDPVDRAMYLTLIQTELQSLSSVIVGVNQGVSTMISNSTYTGATFPTTVIETPSVINQSTDTLNLNSNTTTTSNSTELPQGSLLGILYLPANEDGSLKSQTPVTNTKLDAVRYPFSGIECPAGFDRVGTGLRKESDGSIYQVYTCVKNSGSSDLSSLPMGSSVGILYLPANVDGSLKSQTPVTNTKLDAVRYPFSGIECPAGFDRVGTGLRKESDGSIYQVYTCVKNSGNTTLSGVLPGSLLGILYLPANADGSLKSQTPVTNTKLDAVRYPFSGIECPAGFDRVGTGLRKESDGSIYQVYTCVKTSGSTTNTSSDSTTTTTTNNNSTANTSLIRGVLQGMLYLESDEKGSLINQNPISTPQLNAVRYPFSGIICPTGSQRVGIGLRKEFNGHQYQVYTCVSTTGKEDLSSLPMGSSVGILYLPAKFNGAITSQTPVSNASLDAVRYPFSGIECPGGFQRVGLGVRPESDGSVYQVYTCMKVSGAQNTANTLSGILMGAMYLPSASNGAITSQTPVTNTKLDAVRYPFTGIDCPSGFIRMSTGVRPESDGTYYQVYTCAKSANSNVTSSPITVTSAPKVAAPASSNPGNASTYVPPASNTTTELIFVPPSDFKNDNLRANFPNGMYMDITYDGPADREYRINQAQNYYFN